MGFGGAFSLLGLDSRRLVTGGAEGGLVVATFSIVAGDWGCPFEATL